MKVAVRLAAAIGLAIDIESYIIEDGEIGQQFAQALLERQASGVQVNAIYDSVGAFATDRQFFERLAQAGVQVVEFNPVSPLNLKKGWAPNHRDHRKLLVVDGAIAFLGGINISNVYSSGSSIRHGEQAADAIVDGVWSCVGSSNLDWRSAIDNDEINAVILGREFGQQMQAAYEKDIAASDAIELEAWQRRPLESKLKELGARLWGPLL
ncbi:MAG TPA: phospholipase D-like domain-containing protein [Ramlibacter sp.]|uniref:phospholipase D-like domain-containing protein n=1 Tax=Ramlibacter sp. TaxID=1917967 RepID=UPI002BF89D20|nr:phospholipase D-like domain-containing protein [Ramlibacter sp.]HVZ45709.1 phospholipase D-like domain-containing protein [Ramlibacter sp.]